MGFENFPAKTKQEKTTDKEPEKLEPIPVAKEELTKPETSPENPETQEKEKKEVAAEEEKEEEEEEKPRAEPSPEEIEKAKEQIIARMMQGASQFFDVISRRKAAIPEKKISFKEMEELMDQTLFKTNLSGFKKQTSIYVKLYELDKLEDQQEFVKEFMKITVVNDLMGFELASKTIEANMKLRLQERAQMESENNISKTDEKNLKVLLS